MPMTLPVSAASTVPSSSWSASVRIDQAMVRRDSGSSTPVSLRPSAQATERRTQAWTTARSACMSLPVMREAPQ